MMSTRKASSLPKNQPDTSIDIPSGTVTFLFTDIEGSTQLLMHLHKQYTFLLAEHFHILRGIIAKFSGHVVDTQGDALFASFTRATQAVNAAVEAQRALAAHPWPEEIKLLVRMGLHTGEPWTAEDGYIGIDVHRAARIAHAGHGGQVLMSETTTALAIDELPQGVSLLDLGRHMLKDMRRPECIHQLVIDGLPDKFPPLKSLGVLPQDTTPEFLHPPSFLQSEEELPQVRKIFIASDDELDKLDYHLGKALSGQGRVVFITGGPGRGKTALMNEFSWRAMECQPDLLIVKGGCEAYSGLGDPYLPFRDILTMLTGDLETSWSSGMISKEQARRLWKIFPSVISILIDHTPDLISRLFTGSDLLNRARQIDNIQPNLLGDLQIIIQQSTQLYNAPALDQTALCAQFTLLLNKLAMLHPVVLILDDLQWIDIGSTTLLFHLGRRLAGSRILLVGAYRSEEVALGREGGRHPLDELLVEFKRQYGNIWIDVDNKDASQEQHFVEAYLDTKPNRFSQSFRQALYEHTEGYPLFTVELLQNLQDQGDLVLDEAGQWIEREGINWHKIPSRVEGVIEERIGRLEQEQRDILTIASVEGEVFTAQAISRIQNLDENKLLRTLSQSLDRQHRLIADRGLERLGNNILFLFAFRHNLFQKYLYDHLNEHERVLYHKAVGETLETLYSEYTDKISPQLARHFDIAGLAEKAIKYYTMAGKHAIRLSANHEAIAYIQQALSLLNTLPASSDRSSVELDLQLLLPPSLTAVKGWATPELSAVYDRALELCSELTDDTQLVRTLWLLAIYRMGRSEHEKADKLVKQLSIIVQRTGDPRWTWMDKYFVYKFYQGKFLETRENLENVSQLYEPNQQRILAQSYGMAPSIVGEAYLSNCLWLLGYSEKALTAIQEALKRAKEISVPLIECYVISRSCWLYMQLDEFEVARVRAENLLRISQEHRFRSFELGATFYIHAAQAQKEVTPGCELEQMCQAMDAFQSMGTILNRTAWLVLYSEACTAKQKIAWGLAAAEESIDLGEKTGELWIQAEAYRLRGELLARQSEYYAEAESCFLRAGDIARRQAARSLELRAATSLFRLSEKWGDRDRAHRTLKEVYKGFSEGFTTPDVIKARTLLKI
jgi:predicted ATPase/class 3 adenylate cyclase